MTPSGTVLCGMGGMLRIIIFILVPVLCAVATCDRKEKGRTDLLAETRAPVRPVRVLIASKANRVRVRARGMVRVLDETEATVGSYPADGGLVLEAGESGEVRVSDQPVSAGGVTLLGAEREAMEVSYARDGEWSAGIECPGSLSVSADEEGTLSIINRLDVERYVACVVANEVWPSFETEAYRAQAIVARTYVLHQMERRRRAAFDVRATEGSQVYRGIRRDGTGRRAAEAARYTCGIVCTCRSRRGDGLFSTYYSAACGGASQSAAIFGKADDIPPLRGGVRCDYCRIAPGETYRWGPVRMGLDEVLSRLIERYPELVSLGDIVAIEPIERTPLGRPVRLRITGSSGQEHDILAERFRLAIGSRVVRSTDCDIRVLKDEVIFDNGRGFGHGLGLCQWGTQGQALEGKRAGEILRFYYPGSRLTRVY